MCIFLTVEIFDDHLITSRLMSIDPKNLVEIILFIT